MILLLLFIFIIFNYTSSTTVTIIPYSNSTCNGSQPSGIGYSLQLDTCSLFVSGGSYYYNYLKIEGKALNVYWLDSCNDPLDLNNGTQYTYNLNSCSIFKVPNDNSFLSSFSISTTTKIPSQSIVTSYYIDGSVSCSGTSNKQFITNEYTDSGVQYICKNGQPYEYYCTSNGCYTESLSGCNGVWEAPFPIETTCSN